LLGHSLDLRPHEELCLRCRDGRPLDSVQISEKLCPALARGFHSIERRFSALQRELWRRIDRNQRRTGR
jgi:hypothetical protein